MQVRIPIIRKLTQVRHLLERFRLGLLAFVFLAHRVGNRGGVDAGFFGVNLPERRVIFDGVVFLRLRDRGIVHFAVAVAAIADEIDDDVAAEFCAIFGGETADANDRVGIFGVDVEDGDALALGDVGSETRRMFLNRGRGEADEIVDDDVDGAADGVALEVGEIQRFGEDALAGKGGVAVHDDRPNFVERFARAIDDGPVGSAARLLCAGATHGDGIDGFQMARVRDDVNVERFAVCRDVASGRADVIFHVAGAENAARIDIFESGDDFVRRLAGGVDHDVEAAAMAHGEYGIERASFRRRCRESNRAAE